MKRLIVLLCLSVVHFSWADPETTAGGEDLPLPAGGAAYYHLDSRLYFPQELGGMNMAGIHKWEDEKAGLGIRYFHKTDPIRAEVFLYRSEKPMNSREDMLQGVRSELGKVFLNATKIANTGRYKNLKNSSPKVDALKLPPRGETLLAHTSLTMLHQQREGDPYEAQMWYGVIPYQRYWVRIRITAPAGGEDEAEMKSQDFVKSIIQCLQEPTMRDEAASAMISYLTDPLSEPGRKSADFVLLFAQNHPVFKVIIPRPVTLLLGSVETLQADARLDLQRAFILGVTQGYLAEKNRQEANVQGALLMQKIVLPLRKRHPSLSSKELEALLAAGTPEALSKWLES